MIPQQPKQDPEPKNTPPEQQNPHPQHEMQENEKTGK